MKFERESWRKLYVAESAEHRLLSVFARGMRDYLLRLAGEDGTILANTQDPKADLCKLLGAEKSERAMVGGGYEDLRRITYLSFEGGRLWITKFTDAQSARSPGAARQAEYKKRQLSARESREMVTEPEASPAPLPVTSPGDALQASQIDETRRDETTPQTPVAAVPTLAERAQKVLDNPYDGEFQQPSRWPEVIRAGKCLSHGIEVRFRNNVNSDSDLKIVLQIYADGYTVEQVEQLGKLAHASEYFQKKGIWGPAAFTIAVVRRLFSEPVKPVGMQLPKGVSFGAEGL